MGSDFSSGSSVNIISGSTDELMNIKIIDDNLQEYNETFNVTMQLQSSCLPIALTGEKHLTVTIIDDEGYLILNNISYSFMYLLYTELTVQFNQTSYSGREESGVIIVILSLLGGIASKNFNVRIVTSPVSATGT